MYFFFLMSYLFIYFSRFLWRQQKHLFFYVQHLKRFVKSCLKEVLSRNVFKDYHLKKIVRWHAKQSPQQRNVEKKQVPSLKHGCEEKGQQSNNMKEHSKRNPHLRRVSFAIETVTDLLSLADRPINCSWVALHKS